jgi:PAS domain S-box-containing protein
MPEREFASADLRLSAIVSSSDDAIVSKDLDGTIRSWNRAAELLFGYSAAEAVGRSIRIIIPPDRQSEEDEVLARIGRGESIDHFETIRLRKDGTLIPISLTVSPVRNELGQVVGISKIARDLSEKRRTEAALQAARTGQADLQRRLMMLAAASGSLLLSPRLEDVMPAALNLAMQLLDADGCAIWRFSNGAWRMGALQGVSESFANRIITSNGTGGTATSVPFVDPLALSDVASSPMLGEQRSAYAAEGIASLIAVPLRIGSDLSGTLVTYYRTPRHFTEGEIETARALGNLASAAITTAELYDVQRRSREQSDMIAEAAAALAVSLDYQETLRGIVRLCVPQIADWCAIDLENEQGTVERLAVAHVDSVKIEKARQLQQRFPPDPSSSIGIHHVLRTGAPVLVPEVTDAMLQALARSPEHLAAIRDLGVVSYMCIPLRAHGRTIGVVTFVAGQSGRHYGATDLQFAQDLASRAALAVENARAYDEARRANRVKDEFLATLSHELRTPLNAILGYSRMLKSGMVSTDRLPRAVEIIHKNAASLAKIVEDVLDVSRIISGKLRLKTQPLDLGPILALSIETVQPAADAKGITLRAVMEPGLTHVNGDPDRLQQVMWNLLSNAVKFTPSYGTVTVRLEPSDDQVHIGVTDSGVGIAAEILPHIFERFRQGDSRFAREFGGLGLGLAIARHIVEMHGGTIEASSEGLGKGSTFKVTLPVSRVQLVPVAATETARFPVASHDRRLEGVHVMVVDDENDALQMVRELLETAGARVTTAESAEEALALLEEQRPDLILTDIGMPSIDGFELIRRIRQLPRSIRDLPAAALTAYAQPEDRSRALRSGFQVHLAKPIDPGELITAVESLAGREAH